MKRVRLLLALTVAVAAVAIAVTSGGWPAVMLGFIAVVLVADALVPDFHTPLFESLPPDKRNRLRPKGSRFHLKHRGLLWGAAVLIVVTLAAAVNLMSENGGSGDAPDVTIMKYEDVAGGQQPAGSLREGPTP